LPFFFERMTKIADLGKFKQQALELCLQRQEQQIASLKEAIDVAMESALSEKSGSEDAQDSFREQMQQERNMYANKLAESSELLAGLKRINPAAVFQQVGQGALVVTDKQIFLIAGSLGKMTFDGHDIFVISNQSPIYDAIAGLKKGDTYDFRGMKCKVLDVA